MSAETPRLAFEAVSKDFDGLEAVRDLTLRLMPGEIVCLLGPSGCGKSTSLRIAAGVERQTAGSVLIDGREVAGAGPFVPPERRGVGLMFQDFALFPHLSVLDNVAFGLGKQADRLERAQAVLAQVHMERYADSYPSTLSGGEQQRVALARALAPRPGIMLMDEPFSGLDVVKRDQIRDETWTVLKDTGAATLLVTHDPQEAMRMADRIVLMRQGRIVQAGTPQEIYTAPVDARAAAFFSDLNLFRTHVHAGQAQTPFGPIQAPGRAPGAQVHAMIRPHFLRLVDPEAPEAVRARVVRSVLLGADRLVDAALETPAGAEDVRLRAPGNTVLAPGAVIGVTADPADFFVFDDLTGLEI